ncbi:MAG: hypothetical protein SWN10_09365 [Pseudomonadota bacterium]|nr:hypothetical protein [Pseudomonadota bacterium]
MYNLTCNSKSHVIVALIFAATMLMSSWLMQGHENTVGVFMALVGAYPILARQLHSKSSAGC